MSNHDDELNQAEDFLTLSSESVVKGEISKAIDLAVIALSYLYFVEHERVRCQMMDK